MITSVGKKKKTGHTWRQSINCGLGMPQEPDVCQKTPNQNKTPISPIPYQFVESDEEHSLSMLVLHESRIKSPAVTSANTKNHPKTYARVYQTMAAAQPVT